MDGKATDTPEHRIRPSWRGLRMEMAVSFSLLFVVILTLIGLATVFGIPFTKDSGLYGDETRQVLRNLSLVADLKKDRLLLWLNERKKDLSAVAGSANVRDETRRLIEAAQYALRDGKSGAALTETLFRERSYEQLVSHLHMIRNTYEVYEKIQIVDANRRLVLACSHEKGAEFLHADEQALIRVLDPGRKLSIVIGMERASGKTYLIISHLIDAPDFADRSKEPWRPALIAYINTETFLKPMLHTGGGLGQSGDVVLVDQERKILVDLKYPLADGTRAKVREYVITAEPATLAAQGQEGIVVSRDYRNIPVLAAYRHIRVSPDQEWGMVVKRDQSEVFRPLRRRILFFLITGVLGLVGSAGLSVLIANRIALPIRKLSETAQEVEAENLNVRAPLMGSKEVQGLVATFNSMIDRIQGWQGELEKEVKIRTEELEKKNAELERFTYTVSHDLKSPLITIKSFTGFAREDAEKDDTEALADDLDTISNAASNMGELLDDLLELSRVGRLYDPPTEAPFGKLVREALELLAGSVHERDVVVNVAPNFPVVVVDRLRMVEALQNLIENAIKFMGDQPNPQIDIGFRSGNGETVYYVQDNGMGIEPTYQESVFGLFDKLDRASEGTGIGLALVKRIIEFHGGRIWVESDGKGQGSVFCFTLNSQEVPTQS